ncbi:MAG TPA: hypothetical protein VGH64_10305, partial [Puia sp.]
RYFFYSTTENLLVETKDFNSFYTYTPPIVDDVGRQSFQYIVTKKVISLFLMNFTDDIILFPDLFFL